MPLESHIVDNHVVTVGDDSFVMDRTRITVLPGGEISMDELERMHLEIAENMLIPCLPMKPEWVEFLVDVLYASDLDTLCEITRLDRSSYVDEDGSWKPMFGLELRKTCTAMLFEHMQKTHRREDRLRREQDGS